MAFHVHTNAAGLGSRETARETEGGVIVVTLGASRDSSAELCRKNKWCVGTVLEGDEGYGPERILITAIGEKQILARIIMDRHGETITVNCENLWALEHRDWKAVP